MTMSTSTKEVGKPKLASGQTLDEVMRGVDTWNGEPHGFLRGRIDLVELAGPVVKVFVALGKEGHIVGAPGSLSILMQNKTKHPRTNSPL